MTSPHAAFFPLSDANWRLPLAVAVTGHRDIAPQDEARLRDQVRERLESLRRTFPSTPLLALSGLAEGADMVFAEAALELNITLVAVLPAPPETFAKDFEKPAHPDRKPEQLQQRFETLRAHCRDIVVVANGRLAEDLRRYTFVGAYLVRRCHILFALWDGDENETEGGTSHVVRLAKEGVPNRYRESPRHALDAPDAVVVHHLRTPRCGASLQDAFAWSTIDPTPCNTTSCHERPSPGHLEHLEAFNAAATTFIKNHKDAIASSRQELCLDEEFLNNAEWRILNIFALSDSMALALQRQSRRTLDNIYTISCYMLLLFAVHSNIFASTTLYILYFVSFATGYILYAHEKSKRIYHRFVDYRGLAEGLRVQLFYRLAGVRTMAADLYLRKQRAELAWMRQAMRVLEVGSRREEALTGPVLTQWIRAQSNYFTKAWPKDAKKLRFYGRIVNVGFLLGLSTGAVGLLVELTNPAMHDSTLLHWLFMLTGLFPALGALAGSYAHRRGFGQHIKEYTKMGDMFHRATTLVQENDLTNKPFAFRELVLELGKEALMENGQWVLHHRELPPDLPNK